MRSHHLASLFAVAVAVTFVRTAAAQGGADAPATEPPAAPMADGSSPSADTQPRRSLVPALGRKMPEHLQSGDAYYDLSVRGLRLRLESLKHTDAANYARLDGELSTLEHRRTASYVLFGVGLLAPLATWGVYSALQSQQSCPPMPPATTPNFEAASAAWYECNRANSEFDVTPFAIGGGVMVAALVSALIVAPKRSDLFEFVNLHNRLTGEPIRWQLGYDPARRSAYAGASVHF